MKFKKVLVIFNLLFMIKVIIAIGYNTQIVLVNKDGVEQIKSVYVYRLNESSDLEMLAHDLQKLKGNELLANSVIIKFIEGDDLQVPTIFFKLSYDFSSVKNLDLSWNKVGFAGILALSNHVYLPKLENLDLSFNNITDNDVKMFTQSVDLPSLHSLKLNNNDITEKGATYLACANFFYLRELNLNNNRIGDSGVNAFANAKIGKLSVEKKNYSTDSEISKIWRLGLGLIESKYIEKFRSSLSFKGPEYVASSIKEEAKSQLVQAIADLPIYPYLEILELYGNGIGNEGVISLADSSNFSNLKVLDLHENNINDKGIISLANSSNFPSLERLDLSFNGITDKGVYVFAKAKNNYSALKYLDFYFNNMKSNKKINYLVNNIQDSPKLFVANLPSRYTQTEFDTLKKLQNFPNLQLLNIFFKEDTLSYNLMNEQDLNELKVALNMFKSGEYLSKSSVIIRLENANDTNLKEIFDNSDYDFSEVRFLDLSSNNISDSGIKIIENASNLYRLKILNLSHNQISDIGLKSLVNSLTRYQKPITESVAKINFTNIKNKLFGQALHYTVDSNYLFGSRGLDNLMILNLSHNKIKHIFTENINELSNHPNLRELDLSFNNLGFDEANKLKNLKYLNIDNQIEDDQIEDNQIEDNQKQFIKVLVNLF